MDIVLEAVMAISPELGNKLATLQKAKEAEIIEPSDYQAEETKIKEAARLLLLPPVSDPDLSPMLTCETIGSICDLYNCTPLPLSEENYLIGKNGREVCRVNLPTTTENQLTAILSANT
jgi:hypothetical protein